MLACPFRRSGGSLGSLRSDTACSEAEDDRPFATRHLAELVADYAVPVGGLVWILHFSFRYRSMHGRETTRYGSR